jgi:hypothetical protein
MLLQIQFYHNISENSEIGLTSEMTGYIWFAYLLRHQINVLCKGQLFEGEYFVCKIERESLFHVILHQAWFGYVRFGIIRLGLTGVGLFY